ncbi:hypothetical protein ACQUD4_11755 [Lactococcus lactis]|uniref:hypothetical protein n=1 Tax=Lactococcus lactis TaxID=1358 RepID=UPI003D0F2033
MGNVKMITRYRTFDIKINDSGKLVVSFLMIASFITGYLIDRIYGKKLAEIKSELRGKE